MELQWVWLVVRWLHLVFLQEKKNSYRDYERDHFYSERCLIITICLYEVYDLFFARFVAIAIRKS